MRTSLTLPAKPMQGSASHRRGLCPVGRPVRSFPSHIPLLGVVLLLTCTSLAAQTPATPTVHNHKSVHSQKHATPAQAPSQPAQATALAQPVMPNWPANDLPHAASIVFDSHGLHIVASNSSLTQILKEVATVTGARLEGMDADQRVFGTFGPGAVRDVVTALLDGSGYNVLLIGDRGQGTPRQIVLSAKNRGGGGRSDSSAAPNANPDDDTDSDQETQEQSEPPAGPPNGNMQGMPGRPQQMVQDAQQRQQQLEMLQRGQQPPQN